MRRLARSHPRRDGIASRSHRLSFHLDFEPFVSLGSLVAGWFASVYVDVH